MKANPNTEPIRPASEIAFGVDIKAIPIYILVKFAAVKYHGEVLILLASGVKWWSENYESVNDPQFLLLGVSFLLFIYFSLFSIIYNS